MKEQAVGRRASRADAHRGGAGGAAGAGGGRGRAMCRGEAGVQQPLAPAQPRCASDATHRASCKARGVRSSFVVPRSGGAGERTSPRDVESDHAASQ